MTAEFVRDAAMTAAVLGFFAMGWFGWAQEDPPKRRKKWLVSGSVLATLVLVAAGLLSWTIWNTGTALDRDTSVLFGQVDGLLSVRPPVSDRVTATLGYYADELAELGGLQHGR
ncbi:hypothetical protein ACIBPB_07600 [Micromonospora sp. NPDC049836]|uniref:hypothetical protein n=1 Tax=Micromonospora sp. NPDC049836 TaxID=3364274 RepID=UPI00378DF6CF